MNRILDISYNKISYDGVIAIGKALRSHCKDNSMVATNEEMTNSIQSSML